MAIGGTINGREINWFTIDGGANVWDLDIDMVIAVNQTLSELTRAKLLDPYGITTFTQTLSELTRAKLLATDEDVRVNMAVAQMIATQLIDADGDIEFDMDALVDLFPAMFVDHEIVFAGDIEIDHAFFGHWNDGVRMTLPAENRGMAVEAELRVMSVPPDPVKTARQKTVRVPPDNRRIIVPRDPPEVVRKKDREVIA